MIVSSAVVQIRYLDLVPVGRLGAAQTEALVEHLSRRTSATWRLHPPWPEADLPLLPQRGQVDADGLLARLEAHAPEDGVLVGVTERDLGIPLFTFVLGRGRQSGRAALVSMARLDPRFYGLPADEGLVIRRAVVEALHELGHVAGLAHCEDAACLMSFAASVARVDVRGTRFCPACEGRLPRWLRSTHGPRATPRGA